MKIKVYELSEIVSGEQIFVNRLIDKFNAEKIVLWDNLNNVPKIKMNYIIKFLSNNLVML